jgi:hypothetical protein
MKVKTPKELAEEYGEKFCGVKISKNDINTAWYDGYEMARKHSETIIQEAEARILELKSELMGYYVKSECL